MRGLATMRLNPFGRKKQGRGRPAASGGWLKRETKQALIGVLFIIVGIIAILSFFGAAGPSGSLLLALLRRITGWAGYLLPFALVAWGVYLIRPREEGMPRLKMMGIAMLVIGLLGTLHSIGVSAEDAYQVALDGKGGGLLGFMLSFPLAKAFSGIASSLIFLAAFFAGVFLTFNVSPSEAVAWFKSFVPARGEAEDEPYEEEEGEESRVPVFSLRRRKLGEASPDPDQLKLQQEQEQQEQEQKERVHQQLRAANRKYRPPGLDILHSSAGSKPNSGNVEENKKKIASTLEKFGIAVTMGKVSVGPTVTQYTLKPEEGVKLARITALQNDLALALAAHPIRIEAPIPNTDQVGIEIPNKDVSLVRLRDLLASKDFRSQTSPLSIAVGKNVAGMTHIDSIDRMPHLLVAGATGSGKSIFVNTLILSLLYRNSPALVRMILVDPKRVELSVFNGIPHLLTPVITEPDKTINALKWAVNEMDRRYRLLSESGSKNLMSYNSSHPDEAMPMIVIVIDELADLMSRHARDVEGMIVRLAQMARAIGIHLVLATQRPSVNVITGLIKANIPTRVAFNVASQIDSRTILDMAGAEKLLGSGDMLYLSGDQARPVRLQGSFVSEDEVKNVVNDIIEKNPGEVEHVEGVTDMKRSQDGGAESSGADDELFAEARQLAVDSGKISASLLQRRLRVGYARAARLLDMLEDNGDIGPQEGNKPREILAGSEEGYGQVKPDDGPSESAPASLPDTDDPSRW